MPYVFGDYVLDPQQYELRRRGMRIPRRPKVFQVLTYLIEQRHRVVTRDEPPPVLSVPCGAGRRPVGCRQGCASRWCAGARVKSGFVLPIYLPTVPLPPGVRARQALR
jgi:hypothetical protein